MKPPESYDIPERGTEGRLPVSEPPAVRRHVFVLLRRHRGKFIALIALNAVAALASVIGPQILGDLVEGLDNGITFSYVNKAALIFLFALLVQTLFTFFARMRGAILGEAILADLRENFLTRVVALPPGVVERAGTGDLVTRTTTDVDRLSYAVRLAVPEMTIAIVTAVLVLGALLLTSPTLALSWLFAVPVILIVVRWYFHRAPQAYRREMASYATVNAGVAEAVDAGRTVEAYRLGPARVERTDNAIKRWIGWERYTLFLRTVFFPSVEVAYIIPLSAVLALGGWLYADGQVTLAQVTAAVLYTQMLIEPVDLILMWYDELQVGQASLARLLGVHEVPDPETDDSHEPTSAELEARAVRFGYREGRDVLHGVDLDVAPGERVAIVGPSGAGKSTLGRLLAGLHAPRTGTVEMGGVQLSRLPTEKVRRHVALVTQEHHVFVGSLRDNLRLAQPASTDTELWEAIGAVDATDWVSALPEGLETQVGVGRHKLAPAQAQQLALARLVLADPHTLVLDEATSLLDPRAARHLEQSLAAVLEGRTVIAIAHRLMTAHDAQRVIVVEDGQISEAGSHDELVAANGPYAALWRSWRDED
ncbi:MAG: ABC transporter ATP-binding protein [Candidatus Nanopelagicales bacterium]